MIAANTEASISVAAVKLFSQHLEPCHPLTNCFSQDRL
jgi:hypothetical protein